MLKWFSMICWYVCSKGAADHETTHFGGWSPLVLHFFELVSQYDPQNLFKSCHKRAPKTGSKRSVLELSAAVVGCLLQKLCIQKGLGLFCFKFNNLLSLCPVFFWGGRVLGDLPGVSCETFAHGWQWKSIDSFTMDFPTSDLLGNAVEEIFGGWDPRTCMLWLTPWFYCSPRTWGCSFPL